MKLLVLTAILATVASSPLTENQQWPWQVGKEYLYNVNSYTWIKFEHNSRGNTFKTQFIIRVLSPGRLVARLENPLYTQVQGQLSRDALPSGLNYEPVQKIDHPFEIFVDGGRVLSVKVPTTISVAYENLLKGLISALQVDLSSLNHIDSFPNSYDKETLQGLFKKMETDVTGECETLYSVSPLSNEWRRELPEFAEDPIEITKSKNYASCLHNGGFASGVPIENEEKQIIKHSSESRLLVGKQGTIYKSETLSSVFVSPLLYGKQKAEVYSHVSLHLSSVQPESNTEWRKSVEYRTIDSLLYTLSETALPQVGQSIVEAQKLLEEISPLLQDPNNLSKADFLSKFNVLIFIIMSMNSEQLTLMSSSIKVAKSSKNDAKYNMWAIYRDAVAQAGTIPAFKEIKSWILTKTIEGEEAAEVISSIASILRFSNHTIMNEFLDFALSPEVSELKYVNTTALMGATKFIRSGNDSLFIEEKVIPRLSQVFKQAIEKGDSSKAQVYVRVLGNLAHPNILKVFAPYLEGQITVTKYLRIQMVISLRTLANAKNSYVLAVLFSLLKNTGEPYEVRVAAALNIFMAYPTAEMMKIMAHMTNDDPSTQVRAVLANSINSAAGLKDPRFALLAKNAKAVLSIVSSEKFGHHYSSDSFIDEYTSDDEITHFREFSFIGSKNNILPVYQRGALRFRSTGWTEDWFTISVSDMQRLVDYINGMYFEPKKINTDFKFSAKKIAEILNIKREPPCPLEGSVFLDNWNQQMLLTFNEEDLKSFLTAYIKQMSQLIRGVETHYTKVMTYRQVFVTFPLAMGMPFMSTYSEPTVSTIQTRSKVKLSFSKNMARTFHNELRFTYVRNLEGHVGFIDTLGDLYASAGIINKLQLHIPAKLNTVSKSGGYQVTFEFPKQNSNLMHMSVWPYTAVQKTNSLSTVSEDPSTQYIKRDTKVLSTDFKFGEPAGTVFQFQGYSYSTDFKDSSSLFNADLLTSVRYLLYQKDVALTQFNLNYLAEESQNKAVTYTVFYDTLYNQKQSGEMGPASTMNDVTPNSYVRREEIVKRVASGIESAKVQLVDFSAVFRGKQKVDYVFTTAMASSLVDNKVQAALFFHESEQINAVFKIIKPKISPLNFEEALKNKIKVTYEADVKYGNSDNVHFQGFSERSEKYTEMLSNDAIAKQCLQETIKQNFYQKDCYKMIIKAHTPDHFKATVTYKDLSHEYLNLTYKLYGTLKHAYSWKQEVDVLKKVDDGKLEIEAQAFYYDNYANYKFTSKYGVLRLNNVEGMQYYQYAMAVYAPITSWEPSRVWFTGYHNLPFCTVDDNKIWTFSGRSYDYSLTGSWHVVMVDESNDFGKWTDLVILARRPSAKQDEVYVSYKTETGKSLELEIKPKTIEVKSNTNKYAEGALTTYWDNVANAPLLEYYTLADGIQVFSINNGALRLMYDGQRLVIFTDDHRSTTRGICGQSTTETRDDYMTPYGIVDLPEYYGASFSMEDEAILKPQSLRRKLNRRLTSPLSGTPTSFALMPSGAK